LATVALRGGTGVGERVLAAPESAAKGVAAQPAGERLRGWAAAAVASDPDAIAALRRAGQPGLDALLQFDPPLLQAMRSGEVALDDPKAVPLRNAIERVARQRDAHASGLFWYTDLEEAKAAAAASGKRILSLRLLGNLDEEYSCANSRFFRTVLYANAEVSERLREHYVLHWKSVRPAPIVTIDMGDGRRIKRTITGNSIHYVLNADGTVLDALPGLYGPDAFLAALDPFDEPWERDAATSRAWHAARAENLCRQWLTAGVRVGVAGPAPSDSASAFLRCFGSEYEPVQKQQKPEPKTAEMTGKGLGGELARQHDHTGSYADATKLKSLRGAAITQEEIDALLAGTADPTEPREASAHEAAPSEQMLHGSRSYPTEFAPPAIAKSMVERPISRGTVPLPRPAATPVPRPAADVGPLVQRMSDELWRRVAASHPEHLDESSRRLMMAKLPRASIRADERRAGGVVDEETPFAHTLRRFEAAITQDTTYNAYVFHAQLHRWLAMDESDQLRRDLEALNKRVYTDLFLTPDQDAWLGLVPDDTYTALEKDGCACDPGAPAMQPTERSVK